MDQSYPPEAEEYRDKIHAFLAEHLPAGWRGIGALDPDRQGDGPRPGPDVDHHRRRHTGDPPQGMLHHHLGFGTGHQDPRADGKIEPAEGLMAGQVLERLAADPALATRMSR